VGRTIYFPHNVDFRGRAYPIPQAFNHIGNDVARALLIFDKPKPLGVNGLRWLKIHLANVFGNDKMTFDEREKFIDQNMDSVFASVDDPFGTSSTSKWWTQGDKPWLCLAVAQEVAKAIRSGDPVNFQSHLPVHQDGSCNGLQHYAALGGDRAGAIQVNLMSSDGPQDVYSAVADRVRLAIERDMNLTPETLTADDIKAGVSVDEVRRLATLLTPERIDRKVVKQTVMTSVYGVTFVGAREQIRSRLKEKYSDVYSDAEMNALSMYLTPKVFTALHDMFRGAKDIQDWLAHCAKEIARSVETDDLDKFMKMKKDMTSKRKKKRKENKEDGVLPESTESTPWTVELNSNSSVVWTTPLGLTVVQPYRHQKILAVRFFGILFIAGGDVDAAVYVTKLLCKVARGRCETKSRVPAKLYSLVGCDAHVDDGSCVRAARRTD
jgi:DNA-directed RNA polymerase